MSTKAIFLDKDGTLIDDFPYNIDPLKMRLCSGAGAALRMLARLDYRFYVVSNQDGVAHGHFSETALDEVGNRLTDLLFRERLVLEGFYYCPHHPDGKIGQYGCVCTCRKPMPGMLLRAASEHNIDLGRSWMVGDILHDVEAGNRAGCRTVLIDNGNETEWQLGSNRIPTHVVPDLYAAASLIAGEGGGWR